VRRPVVTEYEKNEHMRSLLRTLTARWDSGAKPLCFHHIPKTAGSSVTAWLRLYFGQAFICPARDWDELIRLGRDDVLGYRVIAGHFGMDLENYLDRSMAGVTVLRHPVERTISHYRHVVRDTGHPRHSHVSRQSLEDFVQDERNWPMIENFQARYLVSTPLRFRDIAKNADRSAEKRRLLSVLSEDARYVFDKSYVREKSTEALAGLAVIGTTDDLGAFLAAIAVAGGPAPPGEIPAMPRENAAPDSSDAISLSERTRDIIGTLTEIDLEIYGRAKSLSSQRAGGAAASAF
jgi:hypothetical protein